MKMKYSGILIVFLVIVALAVSGCSGGSTTTNPTPTAQPGTGTVTPGTSESLTASTIFDTSKLNYYEWRIEAKSDGKTDITNFRIEKGSEPFNGANTNFKKMSIIEAGKEPDTITVYYDASGNAIGAKSGDQVYTAEMAPAMSSVFNILDIGQIWGAANYPLSNSLPETLNINGKNYVCKKWSVGNFVGSAAVWTATVSNVQMAVQIQYGDNLGNSWTYQLWDWG